VIWIAAGDDPQCGLLPGAQADDSGSRAESTYPHFPEDSGQNFQPPGRDFRPLARSVRTVQLCRDGVKPLTDRLATTRAAQAECC
jgi:hypothetical protein